MHYLSAEIYSSSFGISDMNLSKGKTVYIPVPDGHITQDEVDAEVNAGTAIVVEFSKKGGMINVTPKDDTRWLMFGGTFVWSTDSRARRAGFANPVPLHDRYEG